MSHLRFSTAAPGVAMIEIDRPEIHNALNRDAQHQFDEFLARAVADDDVRALVLAGNGGRALSAGWDIGEMTALDARANQELMYEREEWLWRWYGADLPTVVAMQGIAYGVGALLAACADLRVGGPGTRFKVTGMSYGYANLAWLLPELLGTSRAKDVLFTGGVLGGERAYQYGLLNRLVPDAEIRDAAVALAVEVAALPPGGVRDAKRLAREGSGLGARERYDAENRRIREALSGQSASDLFSGFGSGGDSSSGSGGDSSSG